MRKLTDPSSEVPLQGLEAYHSEFLASRREELLSLKKALTSLDYVSITAQAHTWKGFARPYGFQELEGLSIQLEQASLTGQAETCADLLNQIDDYLGSDDP